MRSHSPLVTLALLLGAAALPAATFEEPQLGYRVTVPAGWMQHHDRAHQVLLLKGPGDVRVRVESREVGAPLEKGDVGSWYRSDGKKLQESSVAFQVRDKASLLDQKLLGGRPTWGYAFDYKPAADAVFQARAWLAGGPSRRRGKHMQVRIMAYGAAKAVAAADEALTAFAASLKWPEAPDDAAPAPTGSAVVVSAQPGTTTRDDGPTDPEGLRRRQDERLEKIASGLDFDNGSLKGGLGVMASGGVSRDLERNRKAIAASAVGRQDRDEDQKNKAAAYLGFLKKP